MKIKFDEDDYEKLSVAGIYAVYISALGKENCLYVGEGNCIAKRWGEHVEALWNGINACNCKICLKTKSPCHRKLNACQIKLENISKKGTRKGLVCVCQKKETSYQKSDIMACKAHSYWGITQRVIDTPDTCLTFRIIETEFENRNLGGDENKENGRKDVEKEYCEKLKPLAQENKGSDIEKDVPDMIAAVRDFMYRSGAWLTESKIMNKKRAKKLYVPIMWDKRQEVELADGSYIYFTIEYCEPKTFIGENNKPVQEATAVLNIMTGFPDESEDVRHLTEDTGFQFCFNAKGGSIKIADTELVFVPEEEFSKKYKSNNF
ncbi:hypothetical protein PT285_11055 [Lactobacillus sp. ESL0791]|uniref:hypothetical protein n=1 Tax=Lactobacillus sp. ESL0791 TaxID=2983234 RepID=UPI0023F7F6AC|nr:hypothetical protein [Lactobacillus sp. ESL0791]MDF7639939.1 hypothetical protein [Lactobacillus sp. ESL0791]